MIRHLTSKKNYNKILSDGFIKVRTKEGRDFGTVSFEKFNGNDIFIEVFSKCVNTPNREDIVAILIDDNELINEGFNIYYTDSTSEKNRKESKYTTKYENIVNFNNDEENDDYIKIGEYVHVEQDIPIKFIKEIKYY
ncbi:hypothetical protein ACSXC4_14960 (plasmid) [Clostridium perfringens]|uniref:hypothetical protein n=1 Tax=Clostridium perfringens TaxID=1502 RepID=UPI00096A4BA5|nr:hypothetical protein [Clostridium perfringens]NGU65300.1 hypothetical protein [Clostridium perfringens]